MYRVFSKNEVHHDNWLDKTKVLVKSILFNKFFSYQQTYQTLLLIFTILILQNWKSWVKSSKMKKKDNGKSLVFQDCHHGMCHFFQKLWLRVVNWLTKQRDFWKFKKYKIYEHVLQVFCIICQIFEYICWTWQVFFYQKENIIRQRLQWTHVDYN